MTLNNLVDLGIRETSVTWICKYIRQPRRVALVLAMFAEPLASNHDRNGRLGHKIVAEGPEKDAVKNG